MSPRPLPDKSYVLEERRRRRRLFLEGASAAVAGMPSLYLGFASAATITTAAGLSWVQSVALAMGMFAAPTQMIVGQLYSAGAGLWWIGMTVAVANCRFFFFSTMMVRALEGVRVILLLPILGAISGLSAAIVGQQQPDARFANPHNLCVYTYGSLTILWLTGLVGVLSGPLIATWLTNGNSTMAEQLVAILLSSRLGLGGFNRTIIRRLVYGALITIVLTELGLDSFVIAAVLGFAIVVVLWKRFYAR